MFVTTICEDGVVIVLPRMIFSILLLVDPVFIFPNTSDGAYDRYALMLLTEPEVVHVNRAPLMLVN